MPNRTAGRYVANVGRVDDFLRAHVGHGLWAGEQVIGLAHARCPMTFNALGVPQHYNHLLAVATSARLILFQSEAEGMFGGRPVCKAGESHAWLYDEIARAELGQVAGLAVHSGGQAWWLRLTPHQGCGPVPGQPSRYDFYPVAEGLDDQGRFIGALLPWIERQVNGGAFPMAPEKRAQVEQRLAMERAAEQARFRAGTERAAARDAAVVRALPKLIPFALFAISIAAGVYSYLERDSDDPKILGEHFNIGLLATSGLFFVAAIAAVVFVFVVRAPRPTV